MSGSDFLGEEARAIRAKIAALLESSAAKPLPAARRRAIDHQLRTLIDDLETALGRIDPVARPVAVFDPSNPKIIGRFTALALVGQERRPLATVGRFHGSGVYAIYFTAAPIRSTARSPAPKRRSTSARRRRRRKAPARPVTRASALPRG